MMMSVLFCKTDRVTRRDCDQECQKAAKTYSVILYAPSLTAVLLNWQRGRLWCRAGGGEEAGVVGSSAGGCRGRCGTRCEVHRYPVVSRT
jgi:hypothetical protein